jgi:hypothetical protein
VQDALWLDSLLRELHCALTQSPVLFVDNMSAIQYCRTGGDAYRSRHVNIRYHFVRDNVERQAVRLEWINSTGQLADIMTKPLQRGPFERLREKLLG